MSLTSLISEKIKILDPSKLTEGVTVEEYTRWLCLIEALEIITNQAKNLNIDLSVNTDWLKPLDLQKYVNERFLSMKYLVLQDIENRL